MKPLRHRNRKAYLMRLMAEHLAAAATCQRAIIELIGKGVTEKELRWLNFSRDDIHAAKSIIRTGA